MNNTLIIGASSHIAQAIIKRALALDSDTRIFAVTQTLEHGLPRDDRIHWLGSDYSETSVSKVCRELQLNELSFHRVFICNGILHNSNVSPEKRLEEFDAHLFDLVMHANTLVPMLWIKHLKPLLKGKNPCVVTVLSARVGSIEDNQLGGWYAYRASKAALNMMLKTASIEYARVAKKTHFLLFHPGTTDTPLSKPFQKNVEPSKLFAPEFVANRLLDIVNNAAESPGIDYLDWDNQSIPW